MASLHTRNARVYVRRTPNANEPADANILDQDLAPGLYARELDGLPAYRKVDAANPLELSPIKGVGSNLYGIVLFQKYSHIDYSGLKMDITLLGASHTEFFDLGFVMFSEKKTFYRNKNFMSLSDSIHTTPQSRFVAVPFAFLVKPKEVLPVSFKSPSAKIDYALHFRVAGRLKGIGYVTEDFQEPVTVVAPDFGLIPPPLPPLHPDDDGFRVIADTNGEIQGNLNVLSVPNEMDSTIWLRPRVLTNSPNPPERDRAATPAYSEFDALSSSSSPVSSEGRVSVTPVTRDSFVRSMTPTTPSSTGSPSIQDSSRLSLSAVGRSISRNCGWRASGPPLSIESSLQSTEDLFDESELAQSVIAPPYSIQDSLPMSPLSTMPPLTIDESGALDSELEFENDAHDVEYHSDTATTGINRSISGGLVTQRFSFPPRVSSLANLDPNGNNNNSSNNPSSPSASSSQASHSISTTSSKPVKQSRYALPKLSTVFGAMLTQQEQPNFRIIAPCTIAGPDSRIPLDVTLQTVLSAHVEASASRHKKEDVHELARTIVRFHSDDTGMNDANEDGTRSSSLNVNRKVWVQVPSCKELGIHAVGFKVPLVEMRHAISLWLYTARPKRVGNGMREEAFSLGQVSIEMLR
ncbi:hypothetical protein BJ741DRAFT_606118 [Chytriomyces cf. hyalinus JEL632]|nr:hypothetical protein BJ741DRAFT_606118 [Chytriomyces cf. hyalinus JEL632]